MFKCRFGQCPKCQSGTIRLIVVRKGLCKQHNEEIKSQGKPKKEPKPKVVKRKESRKGQCELCPPNTIKILQTKRLCQFHNEQKKREEKSRRSVKLVTRAQKKESIKWLKKELDRVFSLYIRWKDSQDGKNKCFTCDAVLPIAELQDGHYESRKFLSLRWLVENNNPQCYFCNVVKNGNYPVYALRMIEKYGKEHLDMLAIKKHNTVKWTAFEYKLMIKDFQDKLDKLQKENDKPS